MGKREKTELEIAKEHYRMWLEVEEAIALGQSYTIGSRSLTRADLSKVAERLDYWRNRVKELESVESRTGRNRIYRAVPRDL